MNLATQPIHKASLYRKVTVAEIENDHTFRSVRYFPELRHSVHEITRKQETIGRDLKQHVPKIDHFRRKKQLKFTHHLEELTKSSLDQIKALSDFRRVISDERMQLRTASLPEAPSRPISPLKLTEEENLASANAKLTKFAISYDSRSFINILAGFQGSNDAGGWINQEELDVQLRRCLNISLHPNELGALFRSIDDNSNGLIEGVEFTRYFFKLGNEARMKIKLENEAIMAKRAKRMQQRAEEEREKIKIWEQEQAKKWEESSIQRECSSPGGTHVLETKQYKDLMERLSLLAVEGLRSSDSANVNRGFDNHLTPHELRLQIERSFGVQVSSAEMGCLLQRFATLEGDHSVDGRLFLKTLLLLGQKVEKRRNEEISRKAVENRTKHIWSKNQPVDCLPKTLGR